MRKERQVGFLQRCDLPIAQPDSLHAGIGVDLNEADARRSESGRAPAGVKLVEDAPQPRAALRQWWGIQQHLRSDSGLPLDREQMVQQRAAVIFWLGEHELEVSEGRELLD